VRLWLLPVLGRLQPLLGQTRAIICVDGLSAWPGFTTWPWPCNAFGPRGL